MASKELLERDQQVAAILRAVNKHQKFSKFTQAAGENSYTEYHFAGQIGPDVSFTKECRKYDTNQYRGELANARDIDITHVDLACKGAKLGRIVVVHKLDRKGLRTVSNRTDIAVISPFWNTKKEVETQKMAYENVTDSREKTVTLGIYRGANETMSEVIDRISDAIAVSKDKVVIAKKLSKLNLPSKITIKNQDALVENLVAQIHANVDREI